MPTETKPIKTGTVIIAIFIGLGIGIASIYGILVAIRNRATASDEQFAQFKTTAFATNSDVFDDMSPTQISEFGTKYTSVLTFSEAKKLNGIFAIPQNQRLPAEITKFDTLWAKLM